MSEQQEIHSNIDQHPPTQEAKNTSKPPRPQPKKLSLEEEITKHEEIAESITLVFRITFAILFSSILASLGYALGSTIWVGIGVLLGLYSSHGAIYGFFMLEINEFIRLFLLFGISLFFVLKLLWPFNQNDNSCRPPLIW